MTHPPARLLILDFDGTIIDSETPHFETVRDTWANYGLELTIERWQRRVGRGDNAHWTVELCHELGADAPGPAEVKALWDAQLAEKNARTEAEPIRPGILDLIERARAADVAIAVASSSPTTWIESHLARLDLARHMAAVRTRDDVAQAKPWPDLFLAAASATRTDPSDAVVIEDSHHGVVAAKAAGMRVVAAPNPVTAGQDLSGADLLVDHAGFLAPGTLGLP